MQLYFELSEVVAYPAGKRTVLDTLTVEHLQHRFIHELSWHPEIAHLAAVHKLNINTMPYEEALEAAIAAGCVAITSHYASGV